MTTTAARGLGWEHQKKRRELLPLAYGKPCPLCGWLMERGQKLHLDHVWPRRLGGVDGPVRIVHAICNTRRGGRQFGHLGGNAAARKRKRVRW